jgi:hypothetical protein
MAMMRCHSSKAYLGIYSKWVAYQIALGWWKMMFTAAPAVLVWPAISK